MALDKLTIGTHPTGINISFAPQADSAEIDFDLAANRLDVSRQDRANVDGWWEWGCRYTDSGAGTVVELLVRDDNLVLDLWLAVERDAEDVRAQAAALVAVSRNIRDVLNA